MKIIPKTRNIKTFFIVFFMFVVLCFSACDMRINKENYNKIETGMSLNEVIQILGDDYDISSDSSYGGYSASCYVWENTTGGNITIIFVNGRVYSKAQAGL